MNLPAKMIIKTTLLFLFFLILYYPSQKAGASSLSNTVKELEVDQISSFDEMKTALTLLKSCFPEAKKEVRPTPGLQKIILAKSGECISRIVTLEQKTDLTQKAKRNVVRSLFLTNRDVIRQILNLNQNKVEDMQETKLDQMEDTAAFFASPEWQQPQYLISLSSYWLGWNGYYSSLLYPADDAFRKDLLDESVGDFSRTFIDFEEDSIVIRSLFGRALCYKEMQKYDRAIRDINSVIERIKRDDLLHVRCRYEKVMISYLKGNYESALSRLKVFREEVSGENISGKMESGLRKLRVKIILALLEKRKDKHGKAAKSYYLDILHELKKLSDKDESQTGELYRFVEDNVPVFGDLPYAELGPVGNLAVADWYFNRKQYDKAFQRYKRLSSSSHRMIKKRMDDVYFRTGYCLSHEGQWQDALSSFASLFKKFPDSSFAGKAACLYYVAATNNYKDNTVKSTYAQYIESIKTYLKHCPNPRDRSEAHFQMGKYYLDKGRKNRALNELSLVGEDSPNYTEARYYVLKSNTDKLESLNKKGLRLSGKAKKVYQDTLRQFEGYQKMVLKQKKGAERLELEAHMNILQAKLYAYGPEGTCDKTLQALEDFENRFPLKKNKERLCLRAKSLRMECYQRLQMLNEARMQINSFLKEGSVNFPRWAFLNECANRFYNSAKKLRTGENISQAGKQAELALMIYIELSSIASKNKDYKKFYDSIQFRMADIYLDENQTEMAKKLYQEKLQRDPRSADAIYNLGLIYEKEGQWVNALDTWRKFSKGLKAGSYHWFEARYRTAKALNQQGKGDKACEIITMTHVLHPELRDEKFRKRFLKLKDGICGRQEEKVVSH